MQGAWAPDLLVWLLHISTYWKERPLGSSSLTLISGYVELVGRTLVAAVPCTSVRSPLLIRRRRDAAFSESDLIQIKSCDVRVKSCRGCTHRFSSAPANYPRLALMTIDIDLYQFPSYMCQNCSFNLI